MNKKDFKCKQTDHKMQWRGFTLQKGQFYGHDKNGGFISSGNTYEGKVIIYRQSTINGMWNKIYEENEFLISYFRRKNTYSTEEKAEIKSNAFVRNRKSDEKVYFPNRRPHGTPFKKHTRIQCN